MPEFQCRAALVEVALVECPESTDMRGHEGSNETACHVAGDDRRKLPDGVVSALSDPLEGNSKPSHGDFYGPLSSVCRYR